MIDLTPEGYVALGTESSVAVLEAKRLIVERLPRTEDDASDLDAICAFAEPPLKRTNVQRALREISGVQRVGKGKKGDAYRFFRPVEVTAQTSALTVGRNEAKA